MDSELRAYLDDILSTIERGGNASLQAGALRNILDERILKSVKKRLTPIPLKPQPPHKVAPKKPVRQNLVKRKAVVKEFDHLKGLPKFKLIKEIAKLNLKEYRADVYDNYRDVTLFLNDMISSIESILIE